MNNFDFESKKYLIYTGLILLFFFLMIIYAFQMVPVGNEEGLLSHEQNISQINNVENKDELLIDDDSTTSELEEEKDDEKTSKTIFENQVVPMEGQMTFEKNKKPQDNEKNTSRDNLEKLNQQEGLIRIEDNNKQEVQESENIEMNLSETQKAAIQFMEADNLNSDGKLAEAIAMYISIAENTSDKRLKAKCNEAIANIYAHQRRFGSAITYAQKAYSLENTASRAFLIARISYKTGEVDKAINLVNDILKRDF